MSLHLTTSRARIEQRPAWSGTAFIVEALFLLVFLVASTAVFVQLFAHAKQQSAESLELSRAVALASNTAERFAANPESTIGITRDGELAAVCTVTPEQHESGILYKAEISVYADLGSTPSGADANVSNANANNAGAYASADTPLYTVSTACYVGGEGR